MSEERGAREGSGVIGSALAVATASLEEHLGTCIPFISRATCVAFSLFLLNSGLPQQG